MLSKNIKILKNIEKSSKNIKKYRKISKNYLKMSKNSENYRHSVWEGTLLGTWLVPMTQFNDFSFLLFKSNFIVC